MSFGWSGAAFSALAMTSAKPSMSSLPGAVGLDEAELVGVPAVGLEALEHVLGQHQIGVAFDLDAVGVEDHGQVAELLVGGQEAASPEMPSSMSPSPQMAQILW